MCSASRSSRNRRHEEPGCRLVTLIPGRASASIPSIPSGLPGASKRPTVSLPAREGDRPRSGCPPPRGARDGSGRRRAQPRRSPIRPCRATAAALPRVADHGRGDGRSSREGVGRAGHEQVRFDCVERAEQLHLDVLPGADLADTLRDAHETVGTRERAEHACPASQRNATRSSPTRPTRPVPTPRCRSSTGSRGVPRATCRARGKLPVAERGEQTDAEELEGERRRDGVARHPDHRRPTG